MRKKLDYNVNIEDFDQDPKLGWRNFLPPPGVEPGPQPEQFREAGDSIKQYFKHNKDRGVKKEYILKWEFSLNFHAFQMYANCNDMKEAYSFLRKAVDQLKVMKPEEIKNLQKDYGPTMQPYFASTLLFLGNKENKQELLNAELRKMLKTPISNYPDTNVVFFPGRVYDMANNPNASYADIFKLPTKLPPFPNDSEWVKANTPEEVKNYIKKYEAFNREDLEKGNNQKNQSDSVDKPSKKITMVEETYFDDTEKEPSKQWKTRPRLTMTYDPKKM